MTKPSCECWIWSPLDNNWLFDSRAVIRSHIPWDNHDKCPYCGKEAIE